MRSTITSLLAAAALAAGGITLAAAPAQASGGCPAGQEFQHISNGMNSHWGCIDSHKYTIIGGNCYDYGRTTAPENCGLPPRS